MYKCKGAEHAWNTVFLELEKLSLKSFHDVL